MESWLGGRRANWFLHSVFFHPWMPAWRLIDVCQYLFYYLIISNHYVRMNQTLIVCQSGPAVCFQIAVNNCYLLQHVCLPGCSFSKSPLCFSHFCCLLLCLFFFCFSLSFSLHAVCLRAVFRSSSCPLLAVSASEGQPAIYNSPYTVENCEIGNLITIVDRWDHWFWQQARPRACWIIRSGEKRQTEDVYC